MEKFRKKWQSRKSSSKLPKKLPEKQKILRKYLDEKLENNHDSYSASRQCSASLPQRKKSLSRCHDEEKDWQIHHQIRYYRNTCKGLMVDLFCQQKINRQRQYAFRRCNCV